MGRRVFKLLRLVATRVMQTIEVGAEYLSTRQLAAWVPLKIAHTPNNFVLLGRPPAADVLQMSPFTAENMRYKDTQTRPVNHALPIYLPPIMFDVFKNS